MGELLCKLTPFGTRSSETAVSIHGWFFSRSTFLYKRSCTADSHVKTWNRDQSRGHAFSNPDDGDTFETGQSFSNKASFVLLSNAAASIPERRL